MNWVISLTFPWILGSFIFDSGAKKNIQYGEIVGENGASMRTVVFLGLREGNPSLSWNNARS